MGHIRCIMWKALGAAFGLTFVADFGDKTQIAILTLAARYGFLSVFLGAAVAFVVVNGLAVTVGVLFARYVPKDVIRYVAAAIFIIAGVISFLPVREEEEEREIMEKKKSRRPFVATIGLMALLELGDKTQLSLIALTSKLGYPFIIFMGGTLAMWATSLIGARAGKGISRAVPLKYIRWLSGVLFLVFGVLIAAGVF